MTPARGACPSFAALLRLAYEPVRLGLAEQVRHPVGDHLVVELGTHRVLLEAIVFSDTSRFVLRHPAPHRANAISSRPSIRPRGTYARPAQRAKSRQRPERLKETWRHENLAPAAGSAAKM
ncbi:hypothetical protein Misp01_63850 [Microtetraspora sp. NBRC 13810]|nr:hypothetical protein Misp01_63850 [Microtetraspora sp. NBRC 13810]